MIICTLSTISHFHRASVMAESAKAHHPNAHLILCLIEKNLHPDAHRSRRFDRVLLACDLPVPDFHKYVFMRKVHEASYALKGHFIRHLMNLYPEENHFVFLDTDTEILSPMKEVPETLENHPIILTPHELYGTQKKYLFHGIINIGFIALRRCEETRRFLDWWTDRVDQYGFDENRGKGLFYEQNWLNLALAFFDIHVLKHPGYNAAYWNLRERGNWITQEGQQFLVDGRPIRFFHYSHVFNYLPQYMKRYITNGSKAMYRLRERYVSKLRRAGIHKYAKIPWSYDFYDNGTPISADARTKYRGRMELQRKYPNPYRSSNHILLWNKPLTIVQLMSNAPYAYPLPPFNQGGTEKVVNDLTEELVRRGHRVYVYAPKGSESSAQVIPYPARIRERDIAAFVARTLPKDADLIHDHTFSSVTRRRSWKVPAICTHHIPVNNRVRFPVFVSRRALESLGHNRGYYVHNGICPEDYEYSEEKMGYLLFMGRILPIKGVHHAIQVAELTGKRLVIAGPIKNEAYFNRQLLPRINANPKIEYAGAVGGVRKLELLKHAECLLFTSVYEEPFGLTMVEAMVSGTPVLALRHGAVPEVMAGFPELICDTPEEMAHKLGEAAFPSPESLRDYVLGRFSLSRMADRYTQIYEEVKNLKGSLKRSGTGTGKGILLKRKSLSKAGSRKKRPAVGRKNKPGRTAASNAAGSPVRRRQIPRKPFLALKRKKTG